MKVNCRKLLLTIGGSFLGLAGLFASVNEKGIDYYRAELYDAAKIYFNQQIPQLQGNDKAEAYYYLGETYFATENTDSAAICYKQSISANAEYPYAYIGEGKLALKNGTQNIANDLFKKAIGFAKKNPAIHTAVAEAYIDVKLYDKANETLDKARSLNKNYSGIYVAEGDMLMAQNRVGDACAKYENAILFDKTDKVAYLKEARAYKSINPTLSLELLDRLLEIDPDYIPAYAEIGEINYRTGFYGKAIEAYAKFIQIPGIPLKHQINYASLLYFTKDYEGSLSEIKKILAQDPNNVVMHRLQAYNDYELGNFEQGLNEMEDFLRLIPQDQIIALDYINYAKLLIKNNKPDLAVENFKKALELDSSKIDIYKELAVAYNGQRNYEEAVNYYKQYIEKDPNSTLIDLFTYGQANYSAGTQKPEEGTLDPEAQIQDSLKRVEYLKQADEIFQQVIDRNSTSYLGYLWRGHTNAQLDLDASQGLAKPHYEKALEILLERNQDGSRNREIIEIYRYLGYYYFMKEDMQNTKLYYSKILELDPENEAAKQVLDNL